MTMISYERDHEKTSAKLFTKNRATLIVSFVWINHQFIELIDWSEAALKTVDRCDLAQNWYLIKMIQSVFGDKQLQNILLFEVKYLAIEKSENR